MQIFLLLFFLKRKVEIRPSVFVVVSFTNNGNSAMGRSRKYSPSLIFGYCAAPWNNVNSKEVHTHTHTHTLTQTWGLLGRQRASVNELWSEPIWLGTLGPLRSWALLLFHAGTPQQHKIFFINSNIFWKKKSNFNKNYFKIIL